MKKLGSGTYGDVYKCNFNGKAVAKKNFRISTEGISQSTARELHTIHLMKGLSNIVEIIKVNADVNDQGETIVSIDMKCYQGDLLKFITDVSVTERIKYGEYIITQLLDGLYSLYYRGLIHRDIKPENILVDYHYDTRENKLLSKPECVITDFGFTRQLSCTHQQDETKMTVKVYTPWYRPPELLGLSTDSTYYNFNSDVWAMGATIAEYYAGKPLFQINDLTDSKILQAINNASDGNNIILTPFFQSKLHRVHVNQINSRVIVATERMLTLDPNLRPNINEVIDKPITIKKAMDPLSRGVLNIDDQNYIIEIEFMLNVCIRYRLTEQTAINAIGIFERYLSHNTVDDNDLRLISLIMISLTSLIHEIHPLDIANYYDMCDQYKIQEIKKAQVIIAAGLKYRFSTCEADSFINYITDQPKPLISLKNTYDGLFTDNKQPQLLSYDELTAAAIKYNK